MPSSAAGPNFVVNSLGDAPDANVGDSVCATAGGICTLRAALEEANFSTDANTITFSVAGTISLTAALPDLSSGNITIAGANQTVTIDGGGGMAWWTPCLRLSSNGNAVKGLVITGCPGHGIELGGAGNVIGGTTASEGNVIRDCSQSGIWGFGPTVTGNQILGNRIGDEEGWNPRGWHGIILGSGASGNTVGGSDPGARNVITSFEVGVRLQGAGPGNVVRGNYIGVDPTGSFAIPNVRGVQIDDGTHDNFILGNVISGNWGEGIFAGGILYNVSGSDADLWEPISLDGRMELRLGSQTICQAEQEDGTAGSCFFHANKGDFPEIQVFALHDGCGSVGPMWFTHPRTNEQVQITPGVPNTCPGPGETIFYWAQPINMPSSSLVASGNVIQGNHIGTNAAGDGAIPNKSGGIRVMRSSSDTQIGGTEPGDGNLVSGNWGSGISISGGSQNDIVQGNYVGVDESGMDELPNGGHGIELGSLSDYSGAVGTLVGGEEPGAGNVISGNYGAGVHLWFDTNGVSIKGNRIGTNAAGDKEIGNGNQGIVVFLGAHDNVIGGPTEAERNVISGNAWAGVQMWWAAQHNVVERNYIGLSADGSTAIPNGLAGVDIYDGASENEIRGNVISANDGDGVSVGEVLYSLAGAPDDFFARIQLDDHIEVTWAGEWGIFSGDEEDGFVGNIVFRGNPTWPLVIEVTSDDACASVGPIWLHHLPTGSVQVTGGEDNGCTGDPTIIAYTIPIPVDYAAVFNFVKDNLIGTNPAGDAAIPNEGAGVSLRGSSSDTHIGGPGHGNVISGNRFNGVDLSNGAHDVSVQGNFIGTNVAGTLPLGNGHNGVIVHEGAHNNVIGGTAPGEGNVIAFNHYDGVTVGGASSVQNTIRGNSIHSNQGKGIGLWDGGNAELPAPVIPSVGSVSGTACPSCIVDVYSDSEDEGRIYEGWTVAGEMGNFVFTGSVSGPAVTATATDADGNTSEFSDVATAPGTPVVRIDSAALPPGGQTTVRLWALDVPPGPRRVHYRHSL